MIIRINANGTKWSYGLIRTSIVVILTQIFFINASFAQDEALPTSVQDKAFAIANLIEANKALDLENSIPPKNNTSTDNTSPDNTAELDLSLRAYRKHVMDTIAFRNNDNLKSEIKKYYDFAQSNDSQRDQELSALFNALDQEFNPRNIRDNLEGITKALIPFTNSQDWFVAHHAWTILSSIHSYHQNVSIALQYAENALTLIPSEISEAVLDASIETRDLLAYLHSLLLNTDLAVENTAILVKQKQSLGEPINGVNLINNLVYSFAGIRDHETASALAEIALKIEENTESGTPGLTQMRAAQSFIALGDYDKASLHVKDGLAHSNVASITQTLEIFKIIIRAGRGDGAGAERDLDQLLRNRDISSPFSGGDERRILHARSLIAFTKGDLITGQKLANERMDKSIQSLLKANNGNTNSLLASLANSKERQDERETALRREAELKQAELEQKSRANMFLSLVATLLALAAIFASIFGFWRIRIAKKLAVSAQHAQAGERAKSNFLAMISHELRTPLNGIVGMAELLSYQAKDRNIREKNNIILNSANDLTNLVESILDISRIDAGHFELHAELMDMRVIIAALDEEWRDKMETKKLLFTVYVDNDVPTKIMGDAARLTQCINHLLSNSHKFTDTGRVHVHVTSEYNKDQDKEDISVIVADTGKGIPQAAQKTIFEAFTQQDMSITRSHGGAGLGLTITAKLVKMMNGTIQTNSREGAGSEFIIKFPAKAVGRNRHRHYAEIKHVPIDVNTVDMKPMTGKERGPSSQTQITKKINPAEILRPESPQNSTPVLPQPSHISLPSSDPIASPEPRLLHAAPRVNPPLAQDIQKSPIVNSANTAQSASTPKPFVPVILKTERPPTPTAETVNRSVDTPNHETTFDVIDNTPQLGDMSPADKMRGLSILVVEDIVTNQDIIQIYLQDYHCHLTRAADGYEALNALNTQNFDIILMDIRMPKLDGIETTKRIRAMPNQHRHVPIIALTADTAPKTYSECMAAGVNLFIPKPIVQALLVKAIINLTSSRKVLQSNFENAPMPSSNLA